MNLDMVLAIAGFLAAALLTVYSIVVLHRTVYAIFGIVLTATCSSWFFIRKGRTVDESQFVQHRSSLLMLGTLFFIAFISMIMVYYLRPEQYSRPLLYFIITSIMAGILALEVLVAPLSRRSISLIILQVLLVGFSIQFTQLFMFPDVVGIDPAIHQGLVNGIISSGHITAGADYSTTPLFQIILAAGSVVGGIDYKITSAFVITFIEVVLTPLAVFLFGRFLFNERIGLMAALLITVAPYHIYFGIWAVPNTLAVLFVPLILYLLIKLRKEKSMTSLLLAVFMMIALVMTHPVVAIGMALLLFVAWAVEWSYKRFISNGVKVSVPLGLALFFAVFMFGWWTYVGNQITYFGTQIFGGFQITYLNGVPSNVTSFIYNIPLIEQTLRYLGMIVFFSLALIGCFFMISKRYRNRDRLTIVAVGLLPLVLGFLSLAFALTGLDARWFYLAEVFVAIPIAFTFIAIFSKFRSKAVAGIIVLIMISSVTMLAMASPNGSIDNHALFPNSGVRFAFTESELTGASFLSQSWDGKFASDFDYSTDVSSSVFINYHGVEASRTVSLDQQLLDRNFTNDGSMIIIRSEIAQNAIRVYALPYHLDYDPRTILSQSSSFDQIYDSGSITAYV